MIDNQFLIDVDQDANEMFSIDWTNTKINNSFLMRCPMCGYDNCHFTDELPEHDIPRNSISGLWIGEAGNIVISFICEEGHVFKMVISEHKGEIHLGFTPGDVPFILTSGNIEIDREHEEKPELEGDK